MFWFRLRISLWLCAAVTGCTVGPNYMDPEGPRYTGAYAEPAPPAQTTLRIVTFNIKFGVDYEQATAQILKNPDLRDADIFLLQEMDPIGVEAMAQQLRQNYVYYPAHPNEDGRDFGNAVLARWPIVADHKILLPHLNPAFGSVRISVGAHVEWEHATVLVYSAHTETVWLGPRGRLDQAQAIIVDAEASVQPTVIGGDFNTSDPGGVSTTTKLFGRAGYQWASQDAGTTADTGLFNATLDYLFCRGLRAISSGTTPTEASDHRPVWAVLALEDGR